MKKTLQIPRRRYTRVFASDLSGGMDSFTDSRVLPFSRGEVAYNVCVESGALKNGYGAQATDVPARFHKVFCYKAYDETTARTRHILLAHDRESGKLYGGEGSPDDWQEIAGVTFAGAPMGTNYRLYGEDVFLLCGQEGMAVVYPDLRAVTVASAPDITGIAMHNERMFATIGGRRNAVWFSDDLDPTNWNPELDEGGFIELEGDRGRCNRVAAFGGYVYIFRDYGITRLTAFGNQSEFSVTNLFVSSGRIYADTMAVCGDRILFYADDGLYAFDGLSATRIARALDGIVRGDTLSCACYCNGKYWLATRQADGEETHNVLLTALDPRTGKFSVHKGLCVRAFSPLVREAGETLWICSPDQEVLGEVRRGADYYGAPLKRQWRTGLGDLGAPDRRKLISDVYIDTAYDCTLTVRTERSEKTFALRGKTEVQHKRVNLIGCKAQLEIAAQGDISVARPSLRYATL